MRWSANNYHCITLPRQFDSIRVLFPDESIRRISKALGCPLLPLYQSLFDHLLPFSWRADIHFDRVTMQKRTMSRSAIRYGQLRATCQ